MVISTLFLFLLAACGSDADPEAGILTGKISIGPICPVEPCGEPASNIYLGRELELPPLPVMGLVSEGQTYTGTEGSYCWPDAQTYGGEIVSICADKILWGKLDEPIPVRKGAAVTIKVESTESPQNLSASFYQVGSNTASKSLQLGPGSEVALIVKVPEGTYNLAVFGLWSSGDLSYEFRLEVFP